MWIKADCNEGVVRASKVTCFKMVLSTSNVGNTYYGVDAYFDGGKLCLRHGMDFTDAESLMAALQECLYRITDASTDGDSISIDQLLQMVTPNAS